MFHYSINRIKIVLIDWLVAFGGACLILWCVFTAPVFFHSAYDNSKMLSVDKSDLKKHVEILSSYYAPRTVEFGNLNATADYIYKEFEQYGETQYHSYWTLISSYKNVILELGPKTKEILVIGAHYDAQNNSLDIDGNASGVATLIELAHQLSKNEDKLTIGVQLVAYPLSQKKSTVVENMGSYKHARMLFESGRSVRLMLSLDGVGSFNDLKGSQKYSYNLLRFFYPDKGDYIGVVARLQDYSKIVELKKSFNEGSELPIVSFSLPDSYYSTNSQDHLNYRRYGFSAMLVTDTSGQRKIKYQDRSVVERLDYGKMALLVQGLYQVVVANKAKKKMGVVKYALGGVDNIHGDILK